MKVFFDIVSEHAKTDHIATQNATVVVHRLHNCYNNLKLFFFGFLYRKPVSMTHLVVDAKLLHSYFLQH